MQSPETKHRGEFFDSYYTIWSMSTLNQVFLPSVPSCFEQLRTVKVSHVYDDAAFSHDTVRMLLMLFQEPIRSPYTETPDGALAQQALAGDQWAFETLVHRYGTPLFNFICHLLGDYDLACDVLQQVLLQLFISLSTLHKDKPLKSWLFQVARNRCLDELRRKRVVHFSDL